MTTAWRRGLGRHLALGLPLGRGAGILLALAMLALSLSAGCGGKQNGNLLINPGFENGAEPWHSMDTSGWGEPFEVSDAMAHSGQYSAHLKLVPPPEPAKNRVFGAVQDLAVGQFPDFVSGYYRVEDWQKATDLQYLQFVVIAFLEKPRGSMPNIQIRYLLAGADSEPFEIGNAKFVFLNKTDPVTGEWVHFERDVKADFDQLWGGVPEDLEHVRIFFEARYDSPTETQPQIAGDVYYDDLYAGSKAGAPTD